ncbi:MAG: chemotaxis protein CheA [Magnetococcus sp. WYHC-3]
MAAEIDTSAFTEEAYELLSELEDSLLALEENPEDMELIGRVFRAMHTIKGSGAMFGFDDVAAFTHEVETVFDMVRNQQMSVTKELINLTLSARDYIRSLLDAAAGRGKVNPTEGQRVIDGLRRLAPGGGSGGGPVKTPPKVAAKESSTTESTRTYRVSFKPRPEIFANGTNPLLLIDELTGMGTSCRVVPALDDIPPLEQLDPEKCYVSWDLFLTTERGENALRDVFIFVEDECELKIKVIAENSALEDDPVPMTTKKLGELLIERGAIRPEDLQKVLEAQAPLGERLVNAGLVPKSQVQAALAEQQVVQEQQQSRDSRKQTTSSASVRVPSEKLDVLVDLVGELVTTQARLAQTSAQLGDHTLQAIAEEVERLTDELRDNTMSIRMLAIGTTFNKFKRLVRDLSTELGKEIELTTAGADTELDKTVIDQLNDPLVHIIRNSIDHGVEPPVERELLGKSRGGTIHLSAEHSGASVLIKVNDDGRGLDPNKLRRKAVEKGQLSPDQELTDQEAFQLIFGAGFSTAEKITNVSGRGVGMDVVRKSIDALRGSIDVQSELGKGTTITLKLPLTLAIIEGLLVRIANESFVLPLAVVEECVELTRQDVKNSHGRNVINVRGNIIPYVRLRERFQIAGTPPAVEQVVITDLEGQRIGFVVDGVIGQHQTVIKSLGKNFQHSEEFSGATILGDGTVALILDLQRMVRYVHVEEVGHLQGAA